MLNMEYVLKLKRADETGDLYAYAIPLSELERHEKEFEYQMSFESAAMSMIEEEQGEYLSHEYLSVTDDLFEKRIGTATYKGDNLTHYNIELVPALNFGGRRYQLGSDLELSNIKWIDE